MFTPKVYDFAFSRDTDTLINNIKAVKLDYDVENPRTWPLVISSMIDPGNLGSFLNALLPQRRIGVACSLELINKLASHIPNIKLKDSYGFGTGNDYLSSRFFKYPMNFVQNGDTRKSVEMSEDEIEYWQSRKRPSCSSNNNASRTVANAPITAPSAPKLNLKMTPKPATITSSAVPVTTPQHPKVVAPRVPPSDMVTPVAAFDNIMKSFANKRANASTATTELDTYKKQHAHQKERADKLAQQVDNFKKQNKELQAKQAKNDVDASASATKCEALTKTTQEAETEVKKLEVEAKQQRVELEAARKDAHEANERLIKVWEEMQKDEHATKDKGKRRVEDDGAGGERKKTKLNG